MQEFVECVACGFVTLASDATPEPARWDACPGCGATDFAWPD